MEDEVAANEELHEYICVRCGYVYKKRNDYEPFLCHRCMRYVSKKVWIAVTTITPPGRTIETSDV